MTFSFDDLQVRDNCCLGQAGGISRNLTNRKPSTRVVELLDRSLLSKP
jgi:hypothetical protein